MPTQNEKIQKLQEELKSLTETLDQYYIMFKEDDGIVDGEEEKQLIAMKDVIAKAEAKLISLTKKKKGTTFPTVKMKEIGDFLAKLEAKFGVK